MGNRLDLQRYLETALGSRNVYYQAPSNVSYPCILYEKSDVDIKYADDKKYLNKTRYTITLVSKSSNVDNIVNSIMALDYSSFSRQYINDNLYHQVFDVYY